ncbi:DUF6415 family natural product biosynthesis protein [Streptomyces sp. SM12]|uniref:DUF6415 family natural product biosynthesis protein n=1 Tax=Streptomyces sp. SM12 TaxID=1071602 RepID=UPI0011B0CD01|nr:DUF6415 family natural product biosynthesis protein [Streptomyces sp. SM12]
MTVTAEKWTPPLDTGQLGRMLTLMRAWAVDADDLLDDVGDAVEDPPPRGADRDALAARLRGHLDKLSSLALEHSADGEYARTLVEASQTGRSVPVHEDGEPSLFRLGWTVSELLDSLVAANVVRGVE